MKQNLYAIYDLKARNYEAPLMHQNDEVAKRFFSRLINEIPIMKTSPQDFQLMTVATFCTESAQIIPCPTINLIITGLNCIQPINQPGHDNEKTTIHSQVSNDAPIQSSPES